MHWPDGFALVVGGSGGLGSSICEALADDGADVILTYRSAREAAVNVADKLAGKGRRAGIRQLTLPDGDLGDLGGCHTLVFAAGPPVPQLYISNVDPAAMQVAMSVEFMGFLKVVQAALPALRQARGSIVALTSAGQRKHPPGDVLSTAPKAAITNLIRGLAREEGRFGVRANAVAVGVVDAGMFQRLGFDDQWISAAKTNIPLGRFGRASDVGAAVALAVRATYLSGQTICVDGGYSA